MQNDTKRMLFVAVSVAFLALTLGGCGQKTVKVEPAEETAKVEDTLGVKPPAETPNVAPQSPETPQVESVPLSEAAGPPESLDTPPPAPGSMSGLSEHGDAAGMSGAGEVVPGSRTSVGLKPVFFDFDKSLVRPDQVASIEANAAFLKENPHVKVRIEGNCDNRGTNEYNMALGERRATGAMKYLENLGVAESRLSTLSYGEERPLNSGNDEAAWAENRRGDFVVVR